MIDRRRLLGGMVVGAGLFGAGALARAGHLLETRENAASEAKVVVELFTSQGCSACPPADAFLHDLSKRPDIFAISYNVDYWDYLGWRDTLASPDFTRRQRMYAKARGEARIYTPQVIVNGRHHAVGSDRKRILGLIAREKRAATTALVPLAVRRKGDALIIDAGGAPEGLRAPRKATLWVVPVRGKVRVRIGRGENRGKEISYCNVAQRIVPAGMWEGAPRHLMLPHREIMGAKADICFTLLQLGDHGPIIGAARL